MGHLMNIVRSHPIVNWGLARFEKPDAQNVKEYHNIVDKTCIYYTGNNALYP